MTLKKTTGIVLSSCIIGEADVRVTFLCRDDGKKSFVFKGLKKSSRRPQSAAEPGTVTGIIYNDYAGRELITARDFSVVKYFSGIRSDFAKITCSAFLLELVEQTTAFGNKENLVFDLLSGALFSMEKTDRPLGLAVFFIIHLLRLHGIFDLTLRCKVCGANDFSAFAFDTHDMGVVCGNCSGADKDMLGKDALDFVSASLNTKFSGIAQHNYSAASLRGLLFSMSLFLERYFSMKIRSKELILNITGHIH